MNIDTAIGKELDDLAKEVQLSRYMILDYEIILLTDQELKMLIKNKYKIIEQVKKTDTLEQEIIAFKKENSEFWEKDRKIRRDSYLNGIKYSNAGMEEFVGTPVIDQRDSKNEVIGKVLKVEADGKIHFVLDRSIKLEDIEK